MNIETVYDGSVSGETLVALEISKKEADELRTSLKIIQKYEKLALKSFFNKFKYDPSKESDWYMIGYSVKNDKVIINIRDGSAG